MKRGKAMLLWMLVCVCIGASSAATTTAGIGDAEALQKFLEATLPPASHIFNFSAPLCSWRGVRCASSGAVNGLFLEGMRLRGTIPNATLSKLSSLTQLSLYNNSLESPLSFEILSLTNLEYLSLSLNLFNGQVPAQLSNLARLQRLDLSHNNFSGPIPTQLVQLVNLRYLYLSSNGFTGSIYPYVFDSPSLMFIDLSLNSLIGNLPAQPVTLPQLISLNLSANSLTGELPSDLVGLKSLSSLDLSNNLLRGSLSFLNASSKLEQVILSNNNFTGSIPELKASKVVRLSNNHLAGPVQPAVFSSELRELDLSVNALSGDVSTFLNGSSSSLERLDLSYNKISGSLALVDFSTLTALKYMDLSSNGMKGIIPDSIGKASNLTYIDLSNNKLTGSIPLSFGQLGSIIHLDLSRNSLSGNVSQLLGLRSLRYLNLSYNEGLGCNSALLKTFGLDSFTGVMDCQPSAAEVGFQPSMQTKPKSIAGRAFTAGIVVGCAVALVLLLSLLAVFVSRRRGRWPAAAVSLKRPTFKEDSRFLSGPFSFESNSGPWAANVKHAISVPVVMFEKPLLNLTFADLLRATSNFNKETQVSQGGLGPVYSAVLPGGLHVSIKVLIEGRILSNQAAAAEFALLSKIKHPNLVPLLGYCIVGEERLVIYEFMKNGGLHRWLMGSPERSQDQFSNLFYDVSMDLASRANLEPLPEAVNLSWPVRHKVALGVARALAFLHHGQSTKIVHRDVKASNVMLDEEFEPHLANTGLAGLLAGSNEAAYARGSPGYAPPEYGQAGGEVSTMGDVFSYGVILLELVTGKKPVGDTYEDGDEYGDYGGFGPPNASDLVAWVRLLMQEKLGIVRALDLRACEDQISQDQMVEVLRIGYLCTAESPSKRPTIQQVVGLLKDMAPNITSP